MERQRMSCSRKIILVAGSAVVATLVGMGGYTVVSAGDTTMVQTAELSPADAIKKRQELMKGQGKAAKAINEFVESSTGTTEDVAKHAAELKTSAGEIVALFPAGTSIDDNVAKTAAKKEIWDDFDTFKASADKLGELAGALEAAAGTGDKQQIADAFAAMGKNGCGGCHSKFRQKQE
jgi:cytochrome c556